MACEMKEFLETLGRPLGPQGAGLDAAKKHKCRILSIGPCLYRRIPYLGWLVLVWASVWCWTRRAWRPTMR